MARFRTRGRGYSARVPNATTDLHDWAGARPPERTMLQGRYARLEPLDPARHGADLLAIAEAPDAPDRFRYLFDRVPADAQASLAWVERAATTDDPLFFAVIDLASGRCGGRQALMRIDRAHGVIEIGNILWGADIARTPVATEALLLHAAYAFEALGCRRFEWKCDNRNEPSKRAAERFGFTFEGVFRQHMVVKGENRDTAWFAMTDGEWPAIRAAFDAWLDPSNFDDEGRQIARLADLRASV